MARERPPRPHPRQDIGAVINDIIADVKRRQPDREAKPGAAIVIPPADYDLRTPVVIGISFLTIAGHGHGFNSLTIRYHVDTAGRLELNPGGSHIRVLTPASTAAFTVHRQAAPRLSGFVFRDFCLDGVSFEPDQNSYRNGRTGTEVSTDNDSLHITGMGFVCLERAPVVRGADALRVHDNMIAECGSCVELTGAGQASIVSDNLMGAGPNGPTIPGQNREGLLVTGNNVFPRGRSIVELSGCVRSSAAANGMQVLYPGMLRLVDNCKENPVTANHLRRGVEGFPPFLGVSNGLDDLFRRRAPPRRQQPDLRQPLRLRRTAGPDQPVRRRTHDDPGDRRRPQHHRLNHVVKNVPAQHVVLDASTTGSKVLDSGAGNEITSYTEDVAIRPTPCRRANPNVRGSYVKQQLLRRHHLARRQPV